MEAPQVAVSNEVNTQQQSVHEPSPEVPSEEEDDSLYLTGKPSFDVVLSNSHVNRPQLSIPVHITRELPRATVPVVLRYNGKNWNMSYIGDSNRSRPRFDTKWRTFVEENDLKIGDACVFELMERSSTNIKFKVIILRGDIPPEFMAIINSSGETSEAPIILD